MSKKQYNNKLNGILWLVAAVLLIGLLCSNLDGGISFWNVGRKGQKGQKGIFSRVIVNGVDVTDSYSDSDAAELISASDASYSFDFAGLKKIDIQCVSEQLEIQEGRGNTVDVGVTYEGKYWTEMVVECTDGTLRIYPKKKNRINVVHSGKCRILVTVPRSRSNTDYRMEITNVSGSVTVSGLECKKLDVSNTSGSIHLYDCTAGTVEAGTVSGSVQYENIAGNLTAKTVSGSIRGSYDSLEDDLTAETVSGSIHLDVPDNSSFEASYETVSGSINTDFKKYGSKREGTIVNGDGDQQLSLQTVSGSITIR